MSNEVKPSGGLTSEVALLKLHQDIELEIDSIKGEFSKRNFFTWLQESLSFGSELSKMRWPSVVFMTAQVIAHLVVEFILDVDNLTTNWVGLQGFILTGLLLGNLSINLWDTKLRSKELLIKAERISELVLRCSRDRALIKHWKQLYSHDKETAKTYTIFIPQSPCVHKCLTYRDDSCFNLPNYLLVKDDRIHLFPGDKAPGDCISVNPSNKEPKLYLDEGQVFLPETELSRSKNDLGLNQDSLKQRLEDHVKLRRIQSGSDFMMLSTPYIKSLRLSLQKNLKRPVNSVEKECFIITRKYFETYVIPMVFILSTCVTAIHYGYLDLTDSDHKIKTISIAYLLLRPSLTIMPFLPWMFPFIWMMVNAYGSARLVCCAEAQKQSHQQDTTCKTGHGLTGYRATAKMENLLSTPTAAGSSSAYRHDDEDLHDIKVDVRLAKIFRVFVNLVRGHDGHVWRSSSLLQVLGSLTSLCCIDKVGILSWPNPIPEKLFILPNEQADSQHQEVLDISQNLSFTSPQIDYHSNNANNSTAKNYRSRLTPCSLQFDDLNWEIYLDNLKPLGLGIILNNCCEESFNHYYTFYKHVTYQSILNCELTPVVKRRCMCELSRLIGFFSDPSKNYRLKSQIGIHKTTELIPTSSSPVRKRELTTSHSKSIDEDIEDIDLKEKATATRFDVIKTDNNDHGSPRLKFPFPNMTCNIHEEIKTGTYQMFSQGTADIVLDMCKEYWNGKKLVPLEESHRKKIMDFYQRTSLTSYCSAFSYGPILKSHKLKNHCIQVPSKPLSSCANYLNSNYISDSRAHLSLDDLTCLTETTNDENKNYLLKELMDELSDQIFVGMVATQYQACPDFVALVEQLEHACIRFIHFSRENELRSRVFSEKMGLESGWNCHISLQSERTTEKSQTDEHRNDNTIPTAYSNSDYQTHVELQIPGRISEILYGVPRNQQQQGRYQSSSKALGHDRTDHGDCRSINSSVYSQISWKSLSSLIMKLSANLMSSRARQAELSANKPVSPKSHEYLVASDINSQIVDNSGDGSQNEIDGEIIADQSKGNGLESLVFDMSNRAKLPKGIENIRPHLETVDNVPLQVSLFTDCSPALTKEMIEIMQDYGEIVCVLGSSASVLNTPVFLQANASIAIEPLKPEFCSYRRKRKTRSKSKKSLAREVNEATVKTHNKRGDPTGLTTGGLIDRKMNRKNDIGLDNIQQTPCKVINGGQIDQQHQQSRQQTYNKPRDRLGMAGSEKVDQEKMQQPIITVAQRRVSKLSSSNSSSSETESESSDSDSPTLLNPNVKTKLISNPPSSSESSSTSTSSSSSGSSSDSDSDYSDNDGFSRAGDDLSRDSSSLLSRFPEPMALASALTSLPCCYNFDRQNPINLYALIMEARHFTFKMKNTFVCMICFALSISSAQFLASLLFLPPMYSSGSTIWLTIVVVPLMSLPLMSTTMESQVMKIAVGKNLQLKPENITFFVICYLIKFIPSIIVVVLCFGLIIDHSCKLTGFGASSLGPCWMFTYVKHGNDTTQDINKQEDLLWYAHLLTAQMSSAFLTVLYFGFVHRSKLIWERSPTTNHKWVLTSLALISVQILYSYVFMRSNLNSSDIPYQFLASLPTHVWLISFTWPIIAIGINLMVKRAEIKATIRQQRRARFDFNTKLGMNSPF